MVSHILREVSHHHIMAAAFKRGKPSHIIEASAVAGHASNVPLDLLTGHEGDESHESHEGTRPWFISVIKFGLHQEGMGLKEVFKLSRWAHSKFGYAVSW